MCGIAGFYDFSGHYPPEIGEKEVARLITLQHHRGPDATGVWTASDKRCVLGHARLAIVDLNPRANQPMSDISERYTLTFNGEIYNFKELRVELEKQGCVFQSNSDTEVLIEGYARHGKKFFSLLDGMFALAIYDSKTGDIVLTRDRVGEKPIFYSKIKNTLIFSSEFKPLLTSPHIPSQLTDSGIFAYFALRYIPAPATCVDSIKALLPGTWLCFNRNGTTTEGSFFAFDIPFEKNNLPFNDIIESLNTAFVRSVKRRLFADVPVGAFLSSGIDSSLVCAIAAETGANITCFSAGFVGDKHDETNNAQKIADYLGLPFESYQVSENDILNECSRFGQLLDEPNGDRSCVPVYFLSRLVRNRVTVALSGDGGDELFGGYDRYIVCQKFPEISQSTNPISAAKTYFSKGLTVFPIQQLEKAIPEGVDFFEQYFLTRFSPAFLRPDLNTTSRLRITDFHSYLPGAVLSKVDRMSMQHSLEVRSPFFDPEVMKLASQLPNTLCEKNGFQKIALRQLLGRLLPEPLIRSDKQGFGMPPSFFNEHPQAFQRLYKQASEALASTSFFDQRPQTFKILHREALNNINSYWAWIALGLWIDESSLSL